MTENNAGLVTRALTKTYMRGNTPVHALAGVDLTLPQGTQVAIMGPSGSGKTTLLHCLAGVLRPSSGSITLDGEEMTTMSERALSILRLRRFGFVFQDGQLLPELPTQENIAMPLMLAGTPKSQAIARAALVRSSRTSASTVPAPIAPASFRAARPSASPSAVRSPPTPQ